MINENIEIENAVLGAIILESEAIELVEVELHPKIFDFGHNKLVCEAILSLRKNKENIDILTVSRRLKEKGNLEIVGGSYYVSSLTTRIATSANIQSHVKILQQTFMLKEVFKILQNGLQKSLEPKTDAFDLLYETIDRLQGIEKDLDTDKSFDTIASLKDDYLAELNSKKMGITEPSLSTGLKTIDTYGGLNNTDLIYVGARPGMGKTSFIITTLRKNAIIENEPCGIFSLEMSSRQLLHRIVSAECEINGEHLRSGDISDSDINKAYKRLNELVETNLFIDDCTFEIDRIIAKARKMKRKNGIKLLVIDYLGLINHKGFERDKNGELTAISRKLKMLAKELNIPIITLSQLSREIEKRPLEKRFPILSDLRDSGSIEQDADQVIFLFRPEYYGVGSINIDGTQEIQVMNKCFVSYAKNRHGAIGNELVGFKKEYTEFHDLQVDLPNDMPLPPLQNNNDFLRNNIEETF